MNSLRRRRWCEGKINGDECWLEVKAVTRFLVFWCFGKSDLVHLHRNPHLHSHFHQASPNTTSELSSFISVKHLHPSHHCSLISRQTFFANLTVNLPHLPAHQAKKETKTQA
jgi:hypothetical protein